MGSGENLTQRREGSAQFWNDELLQPITRGVVDVVALTEALDANGDVGHFLVSKKWEVVSGLVAHFRHKTRGFDFFITQGSC